MNAWSAAGQPPDWGMFNGTGNPTLASVLNARRINTVMDRLLKPGNQLDNQDIRGDCLSLSRGIDYALSHGEIPNRAQVMPELMKQICQQSHDEYLHAALMVLMISVKNACKVGWFQTKESEELLTIADKMGKIYGSTGNLNAGPSSCHSTITTIMERFYPTMTLGPIIASVEAKPGYGASVVDFNIAKSEHLQDKIHLLVAQTDNIETSACLISPQQVNFLLNGKGVEKRINVQMDSGPQMPTNVTGMLKYGTNLLQAVGQFNGNYVILVAYMSATSLLEHPLLQDYVHPVVTSIDSDIIEGPSQISLNCPISFTRIKTPVKGRLCKHFQCFDFDNFIKINSRRPSWRCPHCNQYVCYVDIHLDRNMVEILKNVGENIVEVIVFANGSWKAVLENDRDVDKMQNKGRNCEKEQTELQESTCSPSTVPNVLDLTNDDDYLEIMDTCETADRKPFLGMNCTGVNQSVTALIEDEFWSGVFLPSGRSDTPTVGVSECPVQPDTVSPAFHPEAEGHDNNLAANSAVHNQYSALNNLQLQLNMNSIVNEYGRSSSVPRHINRTPVAVQALPVQSQALRPQQNSVTNLCSLLPSSSSATPHISLSNPASADGLNAILSDAERQQHFSRSPMNVPQVSGVNSSTLQHHSATQSRVPPVNISAASQMQNQYRASGLFAEYRNSHLQQALNPRSAHPMRSSNTPRSHIQQRSSQPGIVQAAGATANSQQARVIATPQVARQGSTQAGIVQAAGATANSQQARVIATPQVARQGSTQAGIVQAAGATANSQQARVMPAVQVARQGSTQAGIFQAAGATANSQQARGMAAAQLARQSPSVSVQNQASVAATRGLTGEQKGNLGGTVQSVSRPDELINLQSEQNWRPTQRMRGSLSGRQFSDDVRQRIIAPTQPPVRSSNSRPQGPQPVRPTSVSPQLDVLIGNLRNAHNSSST
ncbi:E4 SUMO-protein ligase PIAL2 isoform X2 [Gastrolobium bilobum]|uniref:E4 SUMO-protein ligase PIAL2 isoform X2 n=1 Tax=Gastrolobium bilobum TaxID=150636 RepID=UPI002AB19A0D|nr:E4 SUMO-protein ligase PIAL2 isoform X2 [Gastrolobium bilobum]